MPPMPADIVKKEGKEHSIPTLAELGYEGVVSHKFPGMYVLSYVLQFELNYFFNAYNHHYYLLSPMKYFGHLFISFYFLMLTIYF